ncbi:MAG: hypothetical protein ACO1O1_17340 [Adhaeribacter sp.]
MKRKAAMPEFTSHTRDFQKKKRFPGLAQCLLAVLCLLLTLGPAREGQAQSREIQVKQQGYTLRLRPEGFRYALQARGKDQVNFHPVSGLRFSAPGDTSLLEAVSTQVLSRQPGRLECRVTNSQGAPALVEILFFPECLQMKVRPEAGPGQNFVAELRTAPIGPAYGLGDHGGYGPGTNVYGFADNRFLNQGNGHRFVSTFAFFPAQALGQVIFENGHKRIAIDGRENKMGASGVQQLNAWYFFGPPAAIYGNYARVRRQEGYLDFLPKYDFFELGYEAFGSLGWNTYQTSVQQDLETYLQQGYHLKWAVVGSGFWKGERKKAREGSTNSFGIWDEVAGPARADGLPNPRYPDVAAFKDFFRRHQIHLLLGLRTNFKAPEADGGHYDPVNNGPFTPQGLQRHYFLEDENQKPRTFKVNFPQGNVYILNPDKPEALAWFADGFQRWGVSGYKEDMMLLDGVKLNNDAKLNKVNELLMQQGQLVMVRNAAYAVAGDILRLEDTKHGFDQDRPVINGLNYAASGAPNVYPDIVAGKYLTLPLTADQKIYFVRNAMLAAVSPAMSMGLGPWHLESPAYEQAVKKAADWHNRLAPYIYSAAVASFHSGYPHTMTPLPVAFPDDAATYDLAHRDRRQYAWMLGPSLLVTPAYGNDYATVQRRPVYLPAGKWQDWETGTLYTGPQTLRDYELPLDKIPAFIGGQGVVVTREKQELRATVYPVAPRGTVFNFTYPDGKSQSAITVRNKGWNPGTLKISDRSTGQAVSFRYEEKHGAFSFPLSPNHHYQVEGGR